MLNNIIEFHEYLTRESKTLGDDFTSIRDKAVEQQKRQFTIKLEPHKNDPEITGIAFYLYDGAEFEETYSCTCYTTEQVASELIKLSNLGYQLKRYIRG